MKRRKEKERKKFGPVQEQEQEQEQYRAAAAAAGCCNLAAAVGQERIAVFVQENSGRDRFFLSAQ